jgi:hypothetical protein
MYYRHGGPLVFPSVGKVCRKADAARGLNLWKILFSGAVEARSII